MVPGLMERERLAAEARRADWLADAARGTVLVDRRSRLPRPKDAGHLARLLAALATVLGPRLSRPSSPGRRAAAAGR